MNLLIILAAFTADPTVIAPWDFEALAAKKSTTAKVFCPHGVDCPCGASCMCGERCTCPNSMAAAARDTTGVRKYDAQGRCISTTMNGIRFPVNEHGAIVSPPHPYQWEVGQYVGEQAGGKKITIQGPQAQSVLQPVTYQQPMFSFANCSGGR